LDCEKWVQADVSSERQAAVDRLASGQATTVHVGAGTTSTSSSSAGALVAAASSPSGPGPMQKGGRAGGESEAAVDGARYKVVWSCLLLVEQVSSLLSMAAHFPMLATDVLSKVVELLRLFNSRATQLVLLAGAMHSAARLPKITGKHLALSAQCLGLLRRLLPHVRGRLARQLPPRQHLLLVELDRVQQDLVAHHERILAKFVSIVGEIVDSLARSLAATDWDRTAPLLADAPGGGGAGAADNRAPAHTAGASQFVADTIKNAQTMHKVLSANLPQEQVQEIFSRIFELLNRKVPLYFESVSPATPAGQQRLVDDVQHLSHSLERLRGINASALNLEPHFRTRFPNAR
jgi:vacuolar protein sorting-associated protein 54